jgi:hypothetical protein
MKETKGASASKKKARDKGKPREETTAEISPKERRLLTAQKLQERNEKIVLAKARGEFVKDIAHEFDLSMGAVYQVLRQHGVVKKRSGQCCIECLKEAEQRLIKKEDVRPAIALERCLKHYQRNYRNKNKERMQEQEQQLVEVIDPDGNPIYKTLRDVRLAAHREAQRRYCEKHPDRLKESLRKYRESAQGRAASKRAVARYREKQSSQVFKDILQRYKMEDTPPPSTKAKKSRGRKKLETAAV